MFAEALVYVVPNYIPLTQQQADTLVAAGFQRGIPFRVADNNQVNRPRAEHHKVACSVNPVNIKRNSVALFETTHNHYGFQFTYSSTVVCEVRVCVGCVDVAAKDNLR